ncbi:CHAD domain-containing protein [Sandaracinus amylolyticus]|uniref:CHAD domain-containing protein n=1 Tax=Sandaracinus amylolyticus TaxID=927083 RepID=A0A0F6WAF9_9BACT|nr:CHAD domain-containing protein [Sandaracinus amylolyticus]AKF11471.1 Hypothetical protein DB32_008620 [Sandaracinus amylolyticus]
MSPRAGVLPLLECIPEEGARRLAVRWIDEACAAGERVIAAHHEDAEALHDLRVALRKLRTVLRTYDAPLDGALSKKRRRKLKDLVAETGTARDTEVQLAWLEQVRGELEGGAHRGVAWLASRLVAKHDDAYGALRDDTVPALLALLPKLRRDLSRYDIEHVVGEARGAGRFADATAALLREQVEDLRDKLREVHTVEDEALAHEARKDGKRLRYLLEPLKEESIEDAKEIVRRLKGLQDLLGELNDVAVRATLLREEIAQAAVERAARLADEAESHASDGVTASSEGDEQLGLLALVRRTHDRREELFAQLKTEWIARDGALDALVGSVETLADGLGPKELPREIERKYLLSAVPDHARAFPCTQLDQGYVPGTELHERLRRTKKDGEEHFFRTVKLGRGLSRVEVEEETTREIFAKMWPLTKGKRVRKRRFAVPEGERTWEIDEFLDRDLVLAEIELPDERTEVTLPAWLAPHVVREVTDEPEFVNLRLAK